MEIFSRVIGTQSPSDKGRAFAAHSLIGHGMEDFEPKLPCLLVGWLTKSAVEPST